MAARWVISLGHERRRDTAHELVRGDTIVDDLVCVAPISARGYAYITHLQMA